MQVITDKKGTKEFLYSLIASGVPIWHFADKKIADTYSYKIYTTDPIFYFISQLQIMCIASVTHIHYIIKQ